MPTLVCATEVAILKTNAAPMRPSKRPTWSPPPRRRNVVIWSLFTVVLLGAAATLSSWEAPRSSIESLSREASSWSTWARVSVIDGDTIRDLATGRSVRLIGFNAPETYEPQCEHEAELGERAKARLRELALTSDLTLTYLPCSCRPGTEGTDACNYGRACGTLRADGRDVGSILTSEGLAVSFVCGATRCPKTPRPWC
jgi:endonuclease YncB( thermonuclease family)